MAAASEAGRQEENKGKEACTPEAPAFTPLSDPQPVAPAAATCRTMQTGHAHAARARRWRSIPHIGRIHPPLTQ